MTRRITRKHGWRVRMDDGRWIEELLGVSSLNPEKEIVLLRFGRFRLIIERPGTEILEEIS